MTGKWLHCTRLTATTKHSFLQVCHLWFTPLACLIFRDQQLGWQMQCQLACFEWKLFHYMNGFLCFFFQFIICLLLCWIWEFFPKTKLLNFFFKEIHIGLLMVKWQNDGQVIKKFSHTIIFFYEKTVRPLTMYTRWCSSIHSSNEVFVIISILWNHNKDTAFLFSNTYFSNL